LSFLRVIAGLVLFFPTLASAKGLPTPPARWKLETILEAPEVKHPSVVCCGPDGRVFVAEDPMDISLPKASAPEGRIICVRADGRRTVFAEKLFAVFGMQYVDGKLYVMHNPKFSVFVDDDGVGRDRVDLIEQTNPKPWALEWNDHVPANFKLAMDGYFYIAVGDKGLFNCVGRDGKRIDMRGGGIVRMRPDGSGLEIYCTGVRNILDVAINEEDELFTYDNTDEHDWMGRFTHMVEGGFYGYPHDFVPRRAYTLWMMEDFGGGAATGTICYTEDALPEEYRGNMFLADFGKRQILRVVVKREGATYRVVSRTDLFSDVPGEFRPVGICLAPDGKSIYICDWQHADTKEQVTVGRLLKLSFTGKTSEIAKPGWYVAAAVGKKAGATAAELVEALSHPSREVRMVAQRRVVENRDAIRPLIELLRSEESSPQARSHAIWALNAMDGGKPAWQAIEAATRAKDVAVRRQAIRQMGMRGAEGKLSVMQAWLDPEPSVRVAVASAIGRIGDVRTIDVLGAMLKDDDPNVRYAAWTAMNRMGCRDAKAWRQIVEDLATPKERQRQGIVFALRETYDLALLKELAEFATNARAPAGARTLAIGLMAEVCYRYPQWKGEWWAYHPALAPAPQKTTGWEGTAMAMAALRAGLDDREPVVRKATVDGLALVRDTGSGEQLRKMFAIEADPRVKRSLFRAFGAMKDLEAAGMVAGVLGDERAEAEMFEAAVTAAGEIGDEEFVRPLSDRLNDKNGPRAIAILNALAKISGDGATKAIAASLEDVRPEVRRLAARVLGERRSQLAVPHLLAAANDPEIGAVAIAGLARIPDARALKIYLRALESKDAGLREQVRGSIAKVAEEVLPQLEVQAEKLPQRVVGELQKALAKNERARKGPIFAIQVKVLEPGEYEAFARKAPGDAKRGQKLFEDADGLGCIRCHSVAGKGGSIGPDLSVIGSQFSSELLIESILYPGKAIREGYQVFTVKTKRGEWFDGLFKGETDAAVMLLDSAGSLHTIPKSEISNRRASSVSLMPEGLQSALSLEEFADLVAYLQSLKSGHAATPAGRN
jgi:putative membrane-bound dehydrogenase-like protein